MADFELVQYEPAMEESWDRFVEESRNGTIFQTQRFLSYHPPDRFQDCSLLFKRKAQTVAVFPAAIRESEPGRRDLVSHPGSSYGGLVLSFDLGLEDTTALLESIVAFASERGLSGVEMRLSPTVFHRVPSQEQDFALFRLGFKTLHLELSSAIQLDPDPELWWQRFRSDTARSIRKALRSKELRVEESAAWGPYWQILDQNLRSRHQTGPTHSLAELMRLKGLFPDRVFLLASYLKETLTGGVVFFVCNRQVLHTFYFAQDYAYQRSRGLNLVVYRLMEWAHRNRYAYINLGISTEQRGRTVNRGLFHFKEGFGARGAVRRSYRKELS